jgi:hypothetical protein
MRVGPPPRSPMQAVRSLAPVLAVLTGCALAVDIAGEGPGSPAGGGLADGSVATRADRDARPNARCAGPAEGFDFEAGTWLTGFSSPGLALGARVMAADGEAAFLLADVGGTAFAEDGILRVDRTGTFAAVSADLPSPPRALALEADGSLLALAGRAVYRLGGSEPEVLLPDASLSGLAVEDGDPVVFTGDEILRLLPGRVLREPLPFSSLVLSRADVGPYSLCLMGWATDGTNVLACRRAPRDAWERRSLPATLTFPRDLDASEAGRLYLAASDGEMLAGTLDDLRPLPRPPDIAPNAPSRVHATAEGVIVAGGLVTGNFATWDGDAWSTGLGAPRDDGVPFLLAPGFAPPGEDAGERLQRFRDGRWRPVVDSETERSPQPLAGDLLPRGPCPPLLGNVVNAAGESLAVATFEPESGMTPVPGAETFPLDVRLLLTADGSALAWWLEGEGIEAQTVVVEEDSAGGFEGVPARIPGHVRLLGVDGEGVLYGLGGDGALYVERPGEDGEVFESATLRDPVVRRDDFYVVASSGLLHLNRGSAEERRVLRRWIDDGWVRFGPSAPTAATGVAVRGDRIFLYTSALQVFELRDDSWEGLTPARAVDGVRAIQVLADGRVVAGTGDGALFFDGGRWTPLDLGGPVNDLAITPDALFARGTLAAGGRSSVGLSVLLAP